MKLPKIKTNNTIDQQLNKIIDEVEELKYELVMPCNEENIGMETLDVLTSAYNLYIKVCEEIGISKSTYAKWHSKMVGYAKDPNRQYQIEGWVEIKRIHINTVSIVKKKCQKKI